MRTNQVLYVLTTVTGVLLLPVQLVTTFVTGCLAQVTLGLFLLLLSVPWLVLLTALLGLSWLWLRAPLLRLPLAFVGVPVALIASTFSRLVTSMGEWESRVQKLVLADSWPYSLLVWQLDSRDPGRAFSYPHGAELWKVLERLGSQDPLTGAYVARWLRPPPVPDGLPAAAASATATDESEPTHGRSAVDASPVSEDTDVLLLEGGDLVWDTALKRQGTMVGVGLVREGMLYSVLYADGTTGSAWSTNLESWAGPNDPASTESCRACGHVSSRHFGKEGGKRACRSASCLPMDDDDGAACKAFVRFIIDDDVWDTYVGKRGTISEISDEYDADEGQSYVIEYEGGSTDEAWQRDLSPWDADQGDSWRRTWAETHPEGWHPGGRLDRLANEPLPHVDSVEYEWMARADGLTDNEIAEIRREHHDAIDRLADVVHDFETRFPHLADCKRCGHSLAEHPADVADRRCRRCSACLAFTRN